MEGVLIGNAPTFDLRCEWGLQGIAQLAPMSDAVIIVDVLSFSTCVSIAIDRGATVFPYRWQDETTHDFARSIQAEVALKRGQGRYSLSPRSLLNVEPGTRLVLPSPNGSTLSLHGLSVPTLTGCFRNCQAVAIAAQNYGTRVAVIPAGERWQDGSLRPALEDWLGAGAILSYLSGSRSPEAAAAIALFAHFKADLPAALSQCESGQELIAREFAIDVELAALLNVDSSAPILKNDAFVAAAP